MAGPCACRRTRSPSSSRCSCSRRSTSGRDPGRRTSPPAALGQPVSSAATDYRPPHAEDQPTKHASATIDVAACRRGAGIPRGAGRVCEAAQTRSRVAEQCCNRPGPGLVLQFVCRAMGLVRDGDDGARRVIQTPCCHGCSWPSVSSRSSSRGGCPRPGAANDAEVRIVLSGGRRGDLQRRPLERQTARSARLAIVPELSETRPYVAMPVVVAGGGSPAPTRSSITCQTSWSSWFSFQMPYAVPSSTGGTATSPIAPLTAASTHS
jgi:hypothetical protein